MFERTIDFTSRAVLSHKFNSRLENVRLLQLILVLALRLRLNKDVTQFVQTLVNAIASPLLHDRLFQLQLLVSRESSTPLLLFAPS